ncbi:hypothetical protein SprV_0100269500 [Sparganum proliferum]
MHSGFIAHISAKVERWREHFKHHLNFDTPSTLPSLSSVEESLPSLTYAVPCDPHSEGEIADAIQRLRNNKASGEDGIPAEICKSCVDTLEPWLHEVIEQAWRNEVAPDNWGWGTLVLILKKGHKTKCVNYRGISLIDVALKIFAIVLLRRSQLCVTQGRGPTKLDFVLHVVHRESLWRIMAPDDVPPKSNMIKVYYRFIAARVLVRSSLSQPFGTRSGALQSCILLPILFNYAIDWILGRALHKGDGVEFAPGHRLTDLNYADDIALLALRFGYLQSMVSRTNEVAKSVGLSINAGKTKVFSSLRKCLWVRRDLSIATKVRVYRASVRSVLLYGYVYWGVRVENERKLEVFDHHCLRTTPRVEYTDLVSNETVCSRCNNIAWITGAIQKRRLRWFGHVRRCPP